MSGEAKDTKNASGLRPTLSGHSACPSDELLLAYLVMGLGGEEHERTDHHVRECNRCMTALTTMQNRVSMAAEIPTPVPGPIQERVRSGTGRASRSVQVAPRAWWATIRDRLATVFSLPVLVPAAVAIGALLVVVTQQKVEAPREMSRAVQPHSTLHVTVAEAVVRSQPAAQEQVVATLKRGASLRVIDEQGDWYNVLLPDGTRGWTERGCCVSPDDGE